MATLVFYPSDRPSHLVAEFRSDTSFRRGFWAHPQAPEGERNDSPTDDLALFARMVRCSTRGAVGMARIEFGDGDYAGRLSSTQSEALGELYCRMLTEEGLLHRWFRVESVVHCTHRSDDHGTMDHRP